MNLIDCICSNHPLSQDLKVQVSALQFHSGKPHNGMV